MFIIFFSFQELACTNLLRVLISIWLACVSVGPPCIPGGGRRSGVPGGGRRSGVPGGGRRSGVPGGGRRSGVPGGGRWSGVSGGGWRSGVLRSWLVVRLGIVNFCRITCSAEFGFWQWNKTWTGLIQDLRSCGKCSVEYSNVLQS